MDELEVYYFDGISSKKHTLLLQIDDQFLYFPEKQWKFAFKDVKISTKMKNTPQSLNLPNDLGYCIIKKEDTLQLNFSILPTLEYKKRYIFISLFIMLIFAAFVIGPGSSYFATIIANVMPQSFHQQLGQKSFEILKKDYLTPTKLSEKTQLYLQNEFQKITPNNLHVKLHFYSSKIFKANALSLPSGDIILFDDLVYKDKNEKLLGIIGVLGHEISHVKHKHAIKQLIKTASIGILFAYFIGDFSSILSTLSSTYLSLNYSQNAELQADNDAIISLKNQNYSLTPFMKLFQNLQKDISENTIFKTHPLFKDRILNIKNQM